MGKKQTNRGAPITFRHFLSSLSVLIRMNIENEIELAFSRWINFSLPIPLPLND